MKTLLTIVLLATALAASAQWSNTANNFDDTLHTPVSTALQAQKNPIVLTSYPDGGYFVIWEDDRNYATTKTDIYAQKYDNAGNRLWAADGIPVSNGPNGQHYTFSSNQDYRNRSFAATDSAGGFYITYSDDSITNYYYERVTVQHIKSNGTAVFASPGYIMASSGSANLPMAAQLIADGNKGFFIAYRHISTSDYIHVYCYRDEGGSMKLYGGGRMNENAIQTSSVAACGIRTYVVYPGTTIIDYNIWSDGMGGCNVIMNMNGNYGGQGNMLTYNRVWRAKKNSQSKTFFRNTSGAACPRITEYIAGDVYVMYRLKTDYQSVACGGGGGPLYTYTNYRLISSGYLVIDNSGYDYGYPKGVSASTTGNINVNLIAVTRRMYTNNVLSDFTVQGYAYPVEQFDSIPYQQTSYSNPDFGYNPVAPFSMHKLNFFRDTLLASGNYYPDFSLAGGGNRIYAAALMSTVGTRWVRMQHLSVTSKTADSFAIEYNTNITNTPNKQGEAIGRELSTGYTGTNMSFDIPIVKVANNGRAFFYTREYGRSARVSPIESGAALAWGAMGRAIGTGLYNNNYYSLEQPVVALDATGSSGIIAWKDNRFIPGNTGENIYMRHLDQLDEFNYLPPIKRVKTLPNPYGASYAEPAVLLGSSMRYSMIEVYGSGYGTNPGNSPILDILDNNNLGRLQIGIYQHSSTTRRYNNVPYLNRNYTILPENDATGKQIDMLLYFTKAEFDALKTADNTIADPGYLAVIRQPNTATSLSSTPNAYAPVAGEETLTAISWDSVGGGYSIRVIANGAGNFFIQKMPTVTLCNTAGTTLTSNVTGASYQWMVNTGSNYAAISNDATYSGTNTSMLQISNTPASFSGYRYLCVVDNVKFSNTFYLRVANIWTGAVNNLWDTPGNWSCNTVPTATTDVIVNSGSISVNTATATCNSIQVSPGATVTVAAGAKLTVVK